MMLRFSALLVWTLAAAAAVFWGLRLAAPTAPLPQQTQMATMAVAATGDLTRLLGAAPIASPEVAPPPPDAATRFRLTGVVATRSAREPEGPAAPGLALISVDGKPPRAFRVGEALDGQFSLISVGLRSARVSAAGAASAFVLDLPPPTPAATGVPIGVGMAPGVPAEMLAAEGNPPPGQMGQAPTQGQMLPVGAPQPGMIQPGMMPPPGMLPPGMPDPNARNRAP